MASNNWVTGIKIMAKSRTIVLWGRDDLLRSSFELLLGSQKGWRVISISNEENQDVLMQTVEEVHPDVVIIYLGDDTSNFYLPTELFHKQPKLKVITASLNDNLVEIYSKRDISITSSSEFISMIETDLHVDLGTGE